MALTTWSIMSFPTHSWATGITEETSRKIIVARVRLGLVSQTIRNSGGTFRSARRRSRHVTGASADLGGGRWGGIKSQCNAVGEILGSERDFAAQNGAQKGPIRHHLPESEQAPCFSQGRCMGESGSTETQPSKPVCDSDDRATKVASQVKNWNLSN